MSKSPKKSWEYSGHPGMSYQIMTTKVPGSKVPRSPGTTWDILGCPTRHDYQSPMSKSPKKSWEYSGHPGMSYQIMTTKVPCPKVPRSPGTTWDIPGCPTRHDYRSPRSKSPKKSCILGPELSQDFLGLLDLGLW